MTNSLLPMGDWSDLQIAMILRVFEHTLFSRLKVQMHRIWNMMKALELAAVLMHCGISWSQYIAPGANGAGPGLAAVPMLSYNPWDQSCSAEPSYILNWLSTRATQPTQKPNHYKYIGRRSIFNGVNLPIGPPAGTINYGLFVGSGGSVLLGKVTNTCENPIFVILI